MRGVSLEMIRNKMCGVVTGTGTHSSRAGWWEVSYVPDVEGNACLHACYSLLEEAAFLTCRYMLSSAQAVRAWAWDCLSPGTPDGEVYLILGFRARHPTCSDL